MNTVGINIIGAIAPCKAITIYLTCFISIALTKDINLTTIAKAIAFALS